MNDVNMTNDHIVYYDSLKYYFFMLAIELDIRTSKKLLNVGEKI